MKYIGSSRSGSVWLLSCALLVLACGAEQQSDEPTEQCGNGKVDPGEVCDPAEFLASNCTEDCQEFLFKCGDGILQQQEVCDDGDPTSPICSDCRGVKRGYTCRGEPSVCVQSGLAPDLVVGELEAADRKTLCEWVSSTLGGREQAEDCGDYRYTPVSVDECIAKLSDGCVAGRLDRTVSELEACMSVDGYCNAIACGSLCFTTSIRIRN